MVKGSGALTYQGEAAAHAREYVEGVCGIDYLATARASKVAAELRRVQARYSGPVPPAGDPLLAEWSGSSGRVLTLLGRDGPDCFFCGHRFTRDAPPTVEHLVARAHGGNNGLANSALAHPVCNSMAGAMAVVMKVSLRGKMREQGFDGRTHGQPEWWRRLYRVESERALTQEQGPTGTDGL